jgi:uncharacterized protein (DUF2267 family)
MALHFDKYAHEGNEFIHHLAKELGHQDNIGQTGIILRAVLHAFRDRITVSESLSFAAQLPMFLKAIYMDNWKYKEKPERIRTMDEFAKYVEEEQAKYGESKFNWEKSTTEIIEIVLSTLRKRYLSKGELEDVYAQLPEDIEQVLRHEVKT